VSGASGLLVATPEAARGTQGTAPGPLSAALAIAERDVVKLLHDRTRLAVSLAFPILVIAGLGGILQPSLIRTAGLSPEPVLVSGVLAAALFQSAAAGMLSLIQDRETDFARQLFIAPISRLTLVSGKVLGESLVALVQGTGVVVFAAVIGVRLSPFQLALMIPAALAACILGAAFGLAALAALPNQRAGLQVLPFLVLPQYFAAGVLAPVSTLPGYLALISWIMPLRYAVDLSRAALEAGGRGGAAVLGAPPVIDMLIVTVAIAVLLSAGAALFDWRERDR
jgi:ABC-2 type transport system permease protein